MRVWMVLATVAGAGVLVSAQVAVRGSSGVAQGVVSGDQGALARQVSAQPPMNGAQRALQGYMIDKQLRLLDASTDQAMRDAVILSNCTGMMYLLNKAQQQHELQNVLEIDKWQPSPSKWDQVRTAPSMVDALVKIGPEQNAKISAVLKRYFDETDKPWQDFFASKAYAAMSVEGRRIAAKEFAKKQNGGKNARLRVSRSEEQMAEVRSLLTVAQRAEWDSIKGKYDAMMAAAVNRKP